MSKSFKLLNYCTEDNNFLKLYTELNHDFIIGDSIFINGGFYDVSKIQQMIYQYGVGLNIFNNYFLQGIKIIAIDTANNAFTTNIPADINNLQYPYGLNGNQFGDPTDTVNLAYNAYITDDLYKSVYVSKLVMSNGMISRGIINNGIFGTDKTHVKFNKFNNNETNLVINHIVSKNVIATSCTINDLTSGIITQKIKVNEDLNAGIPSNPFNLSYVSTTPNNNGFGYSLYEQFKITSNTYTSIINNGNFDNIRDGYISINKTSILGGKYGDSLQNTSTIFNSQITVNNATIKNISYPTKLNISNSIIDTFIPLNVLNTSYTVNDYEILLNVEYDTVANKKWVITPGVQYYLSGVNNINADTFSDMNKKMFIEIIDVSYVFGDIVSANITIKLPNTIGSWATFQTNNPLNDLDFTKAKINEYSNSHKLSIVETDSCMISSVFEDTLMSPPLYYIKGTSTLKEGLFNGIFMEKNISINGTSFGESVYLENSVQLINNVSEETSLAIDINYAYVDLKNNALKSNLINCEMVSGTLYNSNVSNSYIKGTSNQTFLNNVILFDGSKVDSDTFWNDISIQFIADEIVSNTIVPRSYLGDRKLPWSTAINGISPLNVNQSATNINKIEAFRSNLYYNSQEQIDASITLNGVPNYSLKYDVPTLYNVQSPFNNNLQFVIADFGKMTLSGSNWLAVNGIKPRILFNAILSTDSDLSTRMQNKLNNVTSGLYTTFPGTTPVSSTAITRVDDNFVKTKSYHNFYAETRSQRDLTVYIKDNLELLDPFPVRSLNNPDTLFYLKLDTQFGSDVDGLLTGDTGLIPNGLCTLKFRHNGIFNSDAADATMIPACFIEIERVIKTEKDLSDVIQNIEIIDCRYCPTYTGTNATQAYAYNIFRPIANHPKNFAIKDMGNNEIQLLITSSNKFVIDIEYWVTWSYDSSIPATTNLSNPYLFTGRNGGERTKHTLSVTLLSDGQTYYIIDGLGNNITDNLGNRFVWNS